MRALAALAQRVAVEAKGRATPAERVHLTLAFVGNVPVGDVERLAIIGRRVASHVGAFELVLDRLGAFRDAGIAWIGASESPAALGQLARELKTELAQAGFRTDERKFKAHLTLARRCTYRPPVETGVQIAWRVDALTLMASELTPQGSRYTELDRAWLGA